MMKEEAGAEDDPVLRKLIVEAERDPDTLAYRLGWQVFGLAARVAESRLLEAAPPVLRALYEPFGPAFHAIDGLITKRNAAAHRAD